MQQAEGVIQAIENAVGLHLGSRQSLADLLVDDAATWDKDHQRVMSDKFSKVYLNPKVEESEKARGANIKQRLIQLIPVVFVLKKVAEFIDSISGDIDDETQFSVSPETLEYLRTVVHDAGLDYRDTDFVELCLERQSDVLCYSKQFEVFVLTMGVNDNDGRFTLRHIDPARREEFQTTVFTKVIGDMATGADNADALGELLDAVVYSDIVLSEDMRDRYIRDAHVLCQSDEYDDDTIYQALASVKTPFHPFVNAFTKVAIIFVLP